MGEPAEEMKWPDIDGAVAQASRMITVLMRVSSLERIEDVDAYVGSLEAIVFELIARHVDRETRGAARAAYKRGIASGLQSSDQSASRDKLLDTLGFSRDQAPPLLAAIRQAGETHGRTIRLEIDRRRAIPEG
ncbi:hypothetical protein [Burkholderia territorii]|uniref:hypothetical protein n=1 Tax=Burkholderia territorii TaxID=1503055 RepID=UPI000AC3025E|nr:hypothetical protein [Burkholderia territorii]